MQTTTTGTLRCHAVPLFRGTGGHCHIEATLTTTSGSTFQAIDRIELVFAPGDRASILDSAELEITHVGTGQRTNTKERIRPAPESTGAAILPLRAELYPGDSLLTIRLRATANADLDRRVVFTGMRVGFAGETVLALEPDHPVTYRPAVVLRAAGQDGCDTYRIPGLARTSSGTLIAVFDVRYNGDKDLQEDIDVGMSRSTDGGRSCEPMKIIVDMDEWGGRPRRANGTGDPSILYDPTTDTVWVAALWMSGATPDETVWRASRPGMSPETTGQVLLVSSSDDGRTWTEPENISTRSRTPPGSFCFRDPGPGYRALTEPSFSGPVHRAIGRRADPGRAVHVLLHDHVQQGSWNRRMTQAPYTASGPSSAAMITDGRCTGGSTCSSKARTSGLS